MQVAQGGDADFLRGCCHGVRAVGPDESRSEHEISVPNKGPKRVQFRTFSLIAANHIPHCLCAAQTLLLSNCCIELREDFVRKTRLRWRFRRPAPPLSTQSAAIFI